MAAVAAGGGRRPSPGYNYVGFGRRAMARRRGMSGLASGGRTGPALCLCRRQLPDPGSGGHKDPSSPGGPGSAARRDPRRGHWAGATCPVNGGRRGPELRPRQQLDLASDARRDPSV